MVKTMGSKAPVGSLARMGANAFGAGSAGKPGVWFDGSVEMEGETYVTGIISVPASIFPAGYPETEYTTTIDFEINGTRFENVPFAIDAYFFDGDEQQIGALMYESGEGQPALSLEMNAFAQAGANRVTITQTSEWTPV